MPPKTGADQERLPWRSDGCSRNNHKPVAAKHILNLASAGVQAAVATTPTRTLSFTSGEASRRNSPSSGQQLPHILCIADWGNGLLLPAAGTIAHTTAYYTKRSHCNRFDARMTQALALVWAAEAQAAPKSAQVWARTSVLGAQAVVQELLPP